MTDGATPRGAAGATFMGGSAPGTGRTTAAQSVLNMVNCILGASVLGYPYCFKASGLLLASLVMLVSVAACRFSYQLLLYCSQLSSRRTYEELAQQSVGRWGRHVVDLCTAATNLGAIVAYLNILADVLSSVAGTLIPPGAEPSRSTFLTGVTLFAALPVGLIVRDHQVVATFCTASVGFIVLFAVVVVGVACVPASTAVASMPLRVWQLDGLLVAFPVMAYSFTAHPYYLGIYSNLASASPQRMLHVTDMAMLLAAFLYWVVGASGYIAFRGRTAGDLLRNFGGTHQRGVRGAYERAIKLCYGLSILGSIPLVIMPFYHLLLPCLGLGSAQAASPNDKAHKHRLSDDESEDAESHTAQPTATATGVSPFAAGVKPGHLAPRNSGPVQSQQSGGSASGTTRTHSTPVTALPTDVVDIKLHHDGIHAAHSHNDDDVLPSPSQHALVVCCVLGLAMLAAIYVPNVEFIFGLTGATASVVISYIMPALVFIRLLDAHPHLTSSAIGHSKALPAAFTAGAAGEEQAGAGLGDGWGDDVVASTPSKVLVPEEVRHKWVWRRRCAVALLVFGLVAGVACTDAILSAVREEAAVVELAHKLVAHELVVEEASRAQVKALKAAHTVGAVALLGGALTAAHSTASSSLSQLQAAQQALGQLDAEALLHDKEDRHAWDLVGRYKAHQDHVANGKVLAGVITSLHRVTTDMRSTRSAVAQLVQQLDSPLGLDPTSSSSSGSVSGASSEAGGELPVNMASSVPSPLQGSGTLPDQAQGLQAMLTHNLAQQQQQQEATLATTTSAGSPLMQVRINAMTALSALDQAVELIMQTCAAVQRTRTSNSQHSRDTTGQRHAAEELLQSAARATSSAVLALQLTHDALAASADQEAQALLPLLNQVVADMQKAKSDVKAGSTGMGTPAAAPPPSPASRPAEADSGAAAAGGGTGRVGGQDASRTGSSDSHTPVDGAPAAEAPATEQRAPSQTANQPGSESASDKHAGSGDGGGPKDGSIDGSTDGSSSSSSSSSSTAGALKKAVEDLKVVMQGPNTTTTTLTSATGSSTGSTPAGSGGTPVLVLEPGGGSTPSSSDGRGGPGSSGPTGPGPGPGAATTVTSGGSSGGGSSQQAGTPEAPAAGPSSEGGQGAGNGTMAGSGPGLDPEEVAAVLKDAATAADDAQAKVIAEMQDTLGKADSKVAERVVDLLKDLSDNQAAIGAKVTRTGSTVGGAAAGEGGSSVNSGITMTTRMAEVVQEAVQQQQQQQQQQQGGQPNNVLQQVTGQSAAGIVDAGIPADSATSGTGTQATGSQIKQQDALARKFGG